MDSFDCKRTCSFTPRCSGRYPWDHDIVVSKIEVPTREQILETICVDRDYVSCTVSVKYNDGRISLTQHVGDLFELKSSIIDIAKEQIVEKVTNYYNKKKIEEANSMGVNSMDIIKGIILNEEAMDKMFYYAHNLPMVNKVETYNDRVVKVTFADGTFTKSVCSPNDCFDIDVGITICLMKKIMGKDGNRRYNDMIRDIHKIMEQNEIEKAKKLAEKQERKAKQRKIELKKAAQKAKDRQEQIDIQTTAVLEALRKNKLENGDDLK